MKIKSIRFSDNTPSFWDNIMGWILLPIGILLVVIFVLCLPFIFIYNFIRRKIFKIKEEESVEYVLFENEEFKLVGISDKFFSNEEEYDEFEWLYHNYLFELKFLIYKIVDRKKPTDLGNSYITHFKIETDTHLYLQKIFQENMEAKNCIISFEKKTGKVKVIGEIGQYILKYYNEKTKTITGYGKEKVIHITLEYCDEKNKTNTNEDKEKVILIFEE